MMLKKQILRFFSATALAVAVCTVAATQEFSATADEVAEWRVQAGRGDADAQTKLGDAYWHGESVAEDKHEAVRWYRKAAEQEDASAQLNLGYAYFHGEGVAEDKRQGVRWYRKAADQGLSQAQFNLGLVYSNGEGATVDKREAVHWYRKAAEQGNAHAQNKLGVAYANGEGIAEDKREAVRWYRKSAAQGYALAQYNLGYAYSIGEGVAEDKREAVRWYHKAAEQGYTKAQHNLGYAYSNGKGVAVDKREAVRWYRKAAEQGNARAQYNLGRAYYNGEGVAMDKRVAVRWWRKAAEQGYAQAQYNLGNAYRRSEGVAEDKREAVRWWRKAAERGFTKAQYGLGFAYAKGEGLITDMREAYIWWSIAKANGSKNSVVALREVNWVNHLTQSEIRSAQKEAVRRLEEIDRSIADGDQNSSAENSIAGNFALAPAPKTDNPAARVFEKTWRSVVVVETGNGQGSGVIIRPNIVATNCHVVDSGGGISVYKAAERRADTETKFVATIRRADREKDFCLLDVKNLWGVVATVRKYETLSVGENVYGLGAPQGLDLSLSAGVISQLRENDDVRLIQTDTAISPGSSGGGLFDSEGNLIGITTSKITGESTEGIGFAIPADLVLGY